jgi:hypothetical protein
MNRMILAAAFGLIFAAPAVHAGNRYLYDTQTGREIGYFSGKYLYDAYTGQEIGYQSGRYIYSSRDGSVLGYCDGD